MKLRALFHLIAGAMAILIGGLIVSSAGARPIYKVTNVSPNPAGTNEFWLTATNITTSINGTNVQVMVYMDDPPGGGGAPVGLPCPLIQVPVGTMIICHFQNKLNFNNLEGASIHWHGIELDNDSDGTAITQDSVLPGQSYVYRFVVPRPGLFWYHSHMLPGNTTFGGMYGPIIVTSTNETSLIASNILPSANYTFPLVMGDISFTNGVVGKVVGGTNFSLNTIIQLCENYALGLSQNDQPFCDPAGRPGDIVLVNGSVPALSGIFCTPNTNSTPIFKVAGNQRVRLQLFCESISRDFNLSLHYPCGVNTVGDTNLYRIGGQGGLLDNARLEGGVQGGYNFSYNKGSIVLGSGMRADVMFYPSGNNGDVIQLVGNPLPPPWNISDGLPSNYPVAFFVITNTGATNAPLFDGAPMLAATGFTNQSLKFLNTNALILPPYSSGGTNSGLIALKNSTPRNATTNNGYIPTGPSIGGYAATALDGNTGDGSWTSVSRPPTALWARVGDVLQLAVANELNGTSMHPYHLHGFSMQPVAIMSTDLSTTLYTYNYNEFVDTIEVYPSTALVFRIHLTDRPKFADTGIGGPVTYGTDASSGGALGRWLMHCHIFLHTTIGMISELNVVPNTINRVEGPSAGSDSVVLAGSLGTAWAAVTNAPWLHLSLANQSGTGSTNVVFTYDANPGATRTSSLNVGGETVNVTQAGSTYVQVPGPPAVLVTNGLSSPEMVAMDGAGNVYIDDSGNNQIKKWTLTNNTVTTLVSSGLSTPQGVAVDSLGNVYFSDFGHGLIKEWVAASSNVVTLTSIGGITSVAVDGAGNLYLAAPGSSSIMKWTAASSTLSTLTSAGLSSPYGVAVDVAGNVYIADTGHNAVREWVAQSGISIPLVFTGLNNPWDVAVDLAGNVYIADGYNSAIKKWTATTGNVTTVASGLGDPTGVTTDATGNVFIADYNNNAVKELLYAFVDPTAKNETAAVTYDALPPVLPTTENLLPPFAPTVNQPWLSLNGVSNGVVNFIDSVNLGSSRSGNITVLGENIPINQQAPSYALATGNILVGPAAGSNTIVLAVIPSIAFWSATANASWLHIGTGYTSGTGNANVLFTFDANPGATRTGTLTIGGQTLTVTQAGATYVVATAPVTGLVTSGLSSPADVAVDGSGNVYISDVGNNAIKKWSVANNTVSTLVSSGLNTPQGVAVDAVGNVYFADFRNAAVKEWTVANSNVITLISNSLVTPSGVAVDPQGNVYVSDPTLNTILEWTAANSQVTTLVSSGLSSPYGVAVDAGGNVYIADTGNNAIKKWSANSYTVSTLVSNGLNNPWNVAVDGSGNVYIADGYNNAIKKWTAANNTVTTLVSAGLGDPTDVAVDGLRNIYIADIGHNMIKALPYAFVDPTAKTEAQIAGSDVLPVVLFPAEDLFPPFAPTADQPWLSIGSVAGGAVNFNFTANPNPTNRIANITLLGQSIPVIQAGIVPPPTITNAKILTNGVFQIGFTNANLSASFSVLFSTNVALPRTNWTVIGTASNISPGVLQFTDTHATNKTRFYMIRSP